MPSFNDKVLKAIPAKFFMISSSADSQISNETFNTGSFELPDPNGKAGGVCTSSILQVLYDHGHDLGKISWTEVLEEMRKAMQMQGYDQLPQLSSSRWIDVHTPLYICPPGSGRRRAVLIGINYVGQKGELSACHNDVNNLKDYLIRAQGFSPSEMLILLDDGHHTMPTKANIENALLRICQYSQPGDVVFVSFSGHGGRIEDYSGDEDDGFDETLIPIDFATNGQLVDDDLLRDFVKPMKKGVHVTVLMDCCHSGTVLDLPYTYSSGDSQMRIEKGFNFGDGADTKAEQAKKAEAQAKKKKKTPRTKKEQEKADERRRQREEKRRKEEEEHSASSVDEGPLPIPEPRKPTESTKDLPPPPGMAGNACCVVM